VSDDPGEVGCIERQGIGPEGVPGLRADRGENPDCLDRCPPFAQQEPEERALGDGAGHELGLFLLEPAESDRVMDVINDGERDEHVAVGKKSGHPSSSSERTSSAVMVRPTDICGMPRFVVATFGGFCPRPKRINSAMTSLIDRLPS
jgi:hypothetical protein